MLYLKITFITGMMLGIEFPTQSENQLKVVIDLLIVRFMIFW